MKLGRFETNHIYNEDCYKAIKDIPDKSIDCIYTDVPYVIQNCGHGGFMADRVNKVQDQLEGLRDGIDYAILDEYVRVCKSLNIFIWCNKFMIKDLLCYFIDKVGCKKYEIMVWCKDNPIPMTNNVWLSDLEYCLWFGDSNTKLNDGYELKSKWFESPINKKDKDRFEHPTIKPLRLVEQHLKHATQENAIILDTFLGSGTTAVAVENVGGGREYIGFEINPTYYKIAVDRLNGIQANGQMSMFLN